MPQKLGSEERFDYFGLDWNTQFWISPKAPECPSDRYHGSGIIETAADYDSIRKFLYPEDAIAQIVERLSRASDMQKSGDTIIWYTLEGFFWFPRALLGAERHLYSFYEDPELYHRICEDLLEWSVRIVGELARHIKADFMTIAEDMSYNKGPMISESTFNEFIKPYYMRLIPEIKKHGTKVVIDTDGDVTMAIPWFAGSGIDGALPFERQSGVDVARIREAFPEFLIIGGFDKMCMLKDRQAIKNEFERLAPAIRSGRFIPSMDHQTPPGTKIDDYRYYVSLLKEYGALACKDCK